MTRNPCHHRQSGRIPSGFADGERFHRSSRYRAFGIRDLLRSIPNPNLGTMNYGVQGSGSSFTDVTRKCGIPASLVFARSLILTSGAPSRSTLVFVSTFVSLPAGIITPRTHRGEPMRTNIVLDEELIREAKQLTALPTKKAVVDEALRTLIRLKKQQTILSLRGKIRWRRVDIRRLRTRLIIESQ